MNDVRNRERASVPIVSSALFICFRLPSVDCEAIVVVYLAYDQIEELFNLEA